MKANWSDSKGYGVVDGFKYTVKPTLTFVMTWFDFDVNQIQDAGYESTRTLTQPEIDEITLAMDDVLIVTSMKYMASIAEPTVHTGHVINDTYDVTSNSIQYLQNKVSSWTGAIEDAYTQAELDEYENKTNKTIQDSMISEGLTMGTANSDRLDVGSAAIIDDQVAHDTWMKSLYDDKDSVPVTATLYKPPETQRQSLAISYESRDKYTFTRYSDTWGHRWYLELFREDVNALAIAIYDAGGNYLYTTGALIDTGNGSWYTECPAGQADATPEDVYYKWLLGSANISDLENYKGSESTREGFVRSDERYD